MKIRNTESTSSLASIPESYEILQEAGLLTYSRVSCLPILQLQNSGFKNRNPFMELTAAGQFWIYTKFPFNSGC